MEALKGEIQENHYSWLKILGMVAVFCMIVMIWPVQELEHQCPALPLPVACPGGWLNYEGKCYFFSEEERSWTASKDFCALYKSSLVIIENETEKAFLLRYMGTEGHWIGQRKDPHQTWKWADGAEINSLLEVKGETGDCAFLSTGFAMSSDCSISRKWICSQPDAYTRNKCPVKGD